MSRWTRLRGELFTIAGLAQRYRVRHADLWARIDRGEDAEAALAALGVVLPGARETQVAAILRRLRAARREARRTPHQKRTTEAAPEDG